MTAEGGGLGKTPESAINIFSSIKYLIWDNVQEKIVGYDQFTENLKTMVMPSKIEYINLFEKYIKQIVQKSPFKNRRVL